MICFSSFCHKIMFCAVKNATVMCTSDIDSACTLNHLPHTYICMLCFYYSDDTESFLIEKRYKGVFSVHF